MDLGLIAGIGLAIAGGLAQEGATVYVNGRTDAWGPWFAADLKTIDAELIQ